MSETKQPYQVHPMTLRTVASGRVGEEVKYREEPWWCVVRASAVLIDSAGIVWEPTYSEWRPKLRCEQIAAALNEGYQRGREDERREYAENHTHPCIDCGKPVPPDDGYQVGGIGYIHYDCPKVEE